MLPKLIAREILLGVTELLILFIMGIVIPNLPTISAYIGCFILTNDAAVDCINLCLTSVRRNPKVYYYAEVTHLH